MFILLAFFAYCFKTATNLRQGRVCAPRHRCSTDFSTLAQYRCHAPAIPASCHRTANARRSSPSSWRWRCCGGHGVGIFSRPCGQMHDMGRYCLCIGGHSVDAGTVGVGSSQTWRPSCRAQFPPSEGWRANERGVQMLAQAVLGDDGVMIACVEMVRKAKAAVLSTPGRVCGHRILHVDRNGSGLRTLLS